MAILAVVRTFRHAQSPSCYTDSMSGSESISASDETAAAMRIAEERWPEGVRCPHCDSPRVSERNRPERRWPQWRCRSCRREFTAVTSTALHGTRLAPSDIERRNSSVEKLFRPSVSGGGAARNPRDNEAASVGMSAVARGVLNALRQRPDGATVAKVAEIAGASERHTRRVLRDVAARGLASVGEGIVRDGHRPLSKPLWRLTYSPECVQLLGRLQRRRAAMPEMPVKDVVPPQFWHLFWSGAEGSELTLSDDEQHVASALIGSMDISAEAWALRNVSTETLESMTETRGYDTGDVCKLIRSELRSRNHVAA